MTKKRLTIADVAETIPKIFPMARLATNELSGQLHLFGPTSWDSYNGTKKGRLWTDTDTAFVSRDLQQAGMFANRETIEAALIIIGHGNKFNPIAQALAALPEWDGSTTVIKAFNECLGVDYTDYYQAEACELLVRGMVARAYEPGVKFDYMANLHGEQGIGKSTFLKMLALDDELFTDSPGDYYGFSGSAERDFEMRIRGKWVVEMGEVSGASISGERLDALKRVITRTEYKARDPYKRLPTTSKRTCVLISTSNVASIPDDPTGNRRFLPIECHGERGRCTFPDYAEDLVRQALAGVVHQRKEHVERGTPYPLTLHEDHPAIASLISDARARATAENPIRETIENYLHEIASVGKLDGEMPRVCPAMIHDHLGWDGKFVATHKEQVAFVEQVMDSMPNWSRFKDGKSRRYGRYGKAYGQSRKGWEYRGPVVVRDAAASSGAA